MTPSDSPLREPPINPLAWLGHHATAALAFGAAAGLFIPGLSALLPPLLPFLIFVFAVASFLKVDWNSERLTVRYSIVPALLLAWVLVFSPVVIAILAGALSIGEETAFALILWAASPSMTAAILFSSLLRLNVALATIVSLSGLALVPLTGPTMAVLLSDLSIDISPLALIPQICAFVGLAAAAACALRYAAGSRLLLRCDAEISGVIVVVLLFYAASLMSGVRDLVLIDLAHSLYYALLAFALNMAMQLVTLLIFAGQSASIRTTAALLAGNRNMGVLYANLGTAAPPEITLFFAASHLPVYVLPYLLKPFYAQAASQHKAG